MKYFVVITFLLSFNIVSAHGNATHETETSGQYKIEFEYDTLGSIQSGSYTTFTVSLLDQNSAPVSFDVASVRIINNSGAPILVGNLNENADTPGTARIGGIIGEPGSYKAEIQFTKSGATAANANFDFNVAATADVVGEGTDRKQLTIFWILGAVVGIALGMLVRRKKQ